MTWRRCVIAVTVGALTGCLAYAPAAFADSYGGHATATVNIRNGPGANYDPVGKLGSGTQVHVYCTAPGTTVNGNNTWDYIGRGQYVSDAYVYTGYDVPIAQPCTFWSSNPVNGHVDINTVPGCGFAGSYANSNFGVAMFGPNTDWYYESGSCDSGYYFTYGNGDTASGDFVRWGYFPGAYARCTITVKLPYAGNHSFNRWAHYKVVTGTSRSDSLGEVSLNQQYYQGSQTALGDFQADGSGYLGVVLDDTSPTDATYRVVAADVAFDCYISLP